MAGLTNGQRACDCLSYNRPDWGGNVPEVILDPRPYFSQCTKTICVDSCISEQIEDLWKAGVQTAMSCCGHNGKGPYIDPVVFITNAEDADLASDILSQDKRDWIVVFYTRAQEAAE